MGLDMYLTAEKYLSEYNEGEKEKAGAIALLFPELGGVARVKNVEVEIMYWRKANAIHAWFVRECQEGVDECQKSYVSQDQLKELVAICKKVLKDPAKAQKLLEPQSGFFFGSTEVDEWYLEDLKRTVDTLSAFLKVRDLDTWSIHYQSSW